MNRRLDTLGIDNGLQEGDPGILGRMFRGHPVGAGSRVHAVAAQNQVTGCAGAVLEMQGGFVFVFFAADELLPEYHINVLRPFHHGQHGNGEDDPHYPAALVSTEPVPLPVCKIDAA